MRSDAVDDPLLALEEGDGLLVGGDVRGVAGGAGAGVVQGVLWDRQSLSWESGLGRGHAYAVTCVGAGRAAANQRAVVDLGATPGQAEIDGHAVGGNGERTRSRVVLGAGKAGEGRRGKEEGRVEHADGGWEQV